MWRQQEERDVQVSKREGYESPENRQISRSEKWPGGWGFSTGFLVASTDQNRETAWLIPEVTLHIHCYHSYAKSGVGANWNLE